MKGIIGIDIGGTKIASCLASFEGEITLWQSLPVEAKSGSEAVMEKLLNLVRRLIGSEAGIDVVSIGVACAGLIDPIKGVVIASPHLPWRDYPLKEKLSDFNLPVFVLNDANAAALGEYYFGAGRGVKDLIYITVSTGIGGGLILGGKLYPGFWGTAGEIGHMTIEVNGPLCDCGNYGCWEALASGSAISRMAEERMGKKLNARQVYEEALKGNPEALRIIKEAGRYFGVGLANLVNIFNPQLIILGGGVSQMGEMFFGPAREEMKRRAYSLLAGEVKLVPSQLGERAGISGLIAYARANFPPTHLVNVGYLLFIKLSHHSLNF